jgi:16S rRNA (guanine(527)-N(7))-methyltransferase RsmG
MSISTLLASALRDLVAPYVPLSGEQIAALSAHFELLLKWNRKMSLTTVTNPREAATRHYGESLFLAHRLTPGSVVDIGSGAGFPGIPAAILRVDCHFDLVESNQRKAVFLREAVRNLPDVDVLAQRAEDVSGRYDWAVSRAVAIPQVLALKLADRVGLLIGESDAASLTGFEITHLPWGERRVLAVRNRCST